MLNLSKKGCHRGVAADSSLLARKTVSMNTLTVDVFNCLIADGYLSYITPDTVMVFECIPACSLKTAERRLDGLSPLG